MNRAFFIPVWLALPLLSACGGRSQGFDSPVSSQRLEATVTAAAEGDRTAVRDLIEMLDSDDPAVRMLGIRALEKLTSRTLGYEYWAPEWKRRQAVDRWVVWYEAEGHLLAAEDQADPQPSP